MALGLWRPKKVQEPVQTRIEPILEDERPRGVVYIFSGTKSVDIKTLYDIAMRERTTRNTYELWNYIYKCGVPPSDPLSGNNRYTLYHTGTEVIVYLTMYQYWELDSTCDKVFIK